MSKGIEIIVDVRPDELVESVVDSLSSANLIEYIVSLDSYSADWSVTEALRDYFVEEMLAFELGEDEEAAVSITSALVLANAPEPPPEA